MSKYIALFLLFALVATSFAASGRRNIQVNTKEKTDLRWWNEGKATILTSKSFEGMVGKGKYVLVQFCATFSKECQALQPEYNKLAEMYTNPHAWNPNLNVGKIDGWTFNSLSQSYSVKKFPTIRLFDKNNATKNDEYTGELTSEKMAEWVENLIKTRDAGKTEEAKPEEPKKEEPKKEEPKKEEPAKEAPKEQAAPETKQPEATNTQANAQQNNEQPPKTEEDPKKEFKLVLNTTLLQAQFDEVQNQLNKLSEALRGNIAENFKKVESLSQAFENHKNDFQALSESIKGQGDKIQQISGHLVSHKEEIKNSVHRHTEDQLNGLKDSVTQIKNKVHEKKADIVSGPGFMHNLIFIAIGGIVGAGAVFLLGGGQKKRRSMLD